MNLKIVERIVDTVLYEGYILYPYRASAVKNRQRFNFGSLYPEDYSRAQSGADSSSMQTEILVLAGSSTTLDVRVRFLHLLAREMGRLTTPFSEREGGALLDYEIVDSLEIGDQIFQSWQEAVERETILSGLSLSELATGPQQAPFAFSATKEVVLLRDEDDKPAGVLIRTHERIEGVVEVGAERVGDRVFKVSVQILNLTSVEDGRLLTRDQALMRSLVSTHTIMGLRDGEFVSLLDPPESLRDAAASCRNVGTWPVLAGEECERDCILSSPIILYDYPQIAPESAGDLFDGTEIDEILTLRIMTLTEEEKREMRGVDERARRILERTETLHPEQMQKLHGAVRSLRRAEGGER